MSRANSISAFVLFATALAVPGNEPRTIPQWMQLILSDARLDAYVPLAADWIESSGCDEGDFGNQIDNEAVQDLIKVLSLRQHEIKRLRQVLWMHLVLAEARLEKYASAAVDWIWSNRCAEQDSRNQTNKEAVNDLIEMLGLRKYEMKRFRHVLESHAMPDGICNESGAPVQFRFDYIDLPGCPTCDSDLSTSCGRCIRVGHRNWLPHARQRSGGSHIYEVSNVIYHYGITQFTGSDAELVQRCGASCGPTWETWPSGPYTWDQYEHEPLSKMQSLEHMSCTDYIMHPHPALIVSWSYSWSVTHFYMDTVFPTFMTMALISQSLACSADEVNVYIVKGETPTPFEPIWRVFAKRVQSVSSMHGCYSRVFYGFMHKNIIPVSYNGIIYDPTLSSWMTAFRLNLRNAIGLSRLSEKIVLTRFLLVDHPRTPAWMKRINWTMPGVEIEPIDFAALSLMEQISAIGRSRGLVGLSGSGLTQQVFLPLGSLVLMVLLLEETVGCKVRLVPGSLAYQQGGKFQDEASSLCYGNAALNLGNTLLYWRWCKPSIWEAPAAFYSREAHAVFELLLSLDNGTSSRPSKAQLCFVLDLDTTNSTWPRCDQYIRAPMAQPSLYCNPFGLIGELYDLKDSWSHVPYCGNGYCSEQQRLVDIQKVGRTVPELWRDSKQCFGLGTIMARPFSKELRIIQFTFQSLAPVTWPELLLISPFYDNCSQSGLSLTSIPYLILPPFSRSVLNLTVDVPLEPVECTILWGVSSWSYPEYQVGEWLNAKDTLLDEVKISEAGIVSGHICESMT